MIETLSSSAEGTGSISGWGIKIPYVSKKKKRQKTKPRCNLHAPVPPPCRTPVLPAVLAGRGLSRTSSHLSHRLLQRAWSSLGILSVCWYISWHGGLSENTPLLPDSLPRSPSPSCVFPPGDEALRAGSAPLVRE